MKKHALWFVLAVLACRPAAAQDLPIGQVIDAVQCRDDPSQHYVLYVPSGFSTERQWPVILAFDAGGRGRQGVERYQAAAERYGFIVAGSNNARNGPVSVSLNAAQAMIADLVRRFPLNAKRIYTAGMSGGARIAMMMALDSDIIAGVFASSAGFPDGFHDSVRFPIFGTAGTDDFNYQEMRALDAGVKSPHRVEIFEGGHVWLPADVAMNGIEWMELQGMKTGLRQQDQKLIADIFTKRMTRVEAQKGSLEQMRELKSLVADFDGLKDVEKLKQRAAAMEAQKDVQDALGAERAEQDREQQTLAELMALRKGLSETDLEVFVKLKARVTGLLEQSKAAADSPDRRIARRVLTAFNLASRRVSHPQFQELMKQIRPEGAQGEPQ